MAYLNTDAWAALLQIVSGSLSDGTRFAELYRVDKYRADKAIRNFTGLKDSAALGNPAARQSIVDYYVRILESEDGARIDSMIQAAVDFDCIQNNREEVIFELMLANFSFMELLAFYGESSGKSFCVMEGALLKQSALTAEARTGFMKRYRNRRERMSFICVLLYALSYGQSCIESLQYKDVNEIGILNKDYIYVIYQGNKIRLKFLCFENTATIINIQKKTTQNSAMNYDMQNPIVVTAKNNSSRISAAGYDVTPGEEDFYYNERIFNLNVVTLEDIQNKYDTIDDVMLSFFRYNQKGRGSFIVSGSDMGVGKSTFLLSMIGEYPDSWGIGILDQQNELQAGVKYPNKNVITLVENTKRDLAQSFAYLLKTSRDVLIVSEITLPEEVSELVNAALRLNAGVSATMHSFSPMEVIPNLRNLMLKTPMYQEKSSAEEDIAGCLDLIIHLKRIPSGRIVVDSVHEVCLDESQRELPDSFKMDALPQDLRYQKELLYSLGIRYLKRLVLGKQYFLRPLFQYCHSETDEGIWRITELPSDRYFRKMSRYTGTEATEQMKQMLQARREEPRNG